MVAGFLFNSMSAYKMELQSKIDDGGDYQIVVEVDHLGVANFCDDEKLKMHCRPPFPCRWNPYDGFLLIRE